MSKSKGTSVGFDEGELLGEVVGKEGLNSVVSGRVAKTLVGFAVSPNPPNSPPPELGAGGVGAPIEIGVGGVGVITGGVTTPNMGGGVGGLVIPFTVGIASSLHSTEKHENSIPKKAQSGADEHGNAFLQFASVSSALVPQRVFSGSIGVGAITGTPPITTPTIGFGDGLDDVDGESLGAGVGQTIPRRK